AARHDGVHLIAFHPRHRLSKRHVAQLGDQPLQDAPADFRVRHLAPAEKDRRLDLVAVLEKALDVLLLELVVVLVDLGPELDLLDEDHFLVLLGLASALLLLVLELAEVHDPADRRNSGRRDLHEIERLASGYRQRLRRGHDSQLLAVVVDHPDFSHPDAFVDPSAVITSWASVESDRNLLTELRTSNFELRSLDLTDSAPSGPATQPQRSPLRENP